jgi:L-iditol 2-dehydrogenase
MIGFLVVQVAKSAGAGEVMAVDIDPKKLALAAANGATSTGTSSTGMEFDVAIEAVGITATVDMAIRSVRKGGNVSLVGNISPTVEMPLQAVVTREISVYGSCGARQDNQRALDHIASDVKVAPMISARISLDDAPEYFQRLYNGDPALMKVMVIPGGV